MQPIALDLILLRATAPDMVIRPGTMLLARVAERHDRHGILLLHGSALLAQLPDEVQEGDRLRLRVEDIGAEKVTMKLMEQIQLPTPPPPGVPLPGGGAAHARVEDDDPGPGGPDQEEGFVSLTWESPALGAMQFRIGLGRGSVNATVSVRAGESHSAAQEAADALREALGSATGRAAQVQVAVRHDPFDIYV